MKPHLAHINNTLIKKKLAEDAKNEQVYYLKYLKLVEKARKDGMTSASIVKELEHEKWRIETHQKDGDAIFKEGLANAKISCLNAIDRIIKEIKQGEN